MLCKTDEMSGFGHLQLSSFRHVRCVFVLEIVIRVRHAGVGASMRRRLVGVAVIGGHLNGKRDERPREPEILILRSTPRVSFLTTKSARFPSESTSSSLFCESDARLEVYFSSPFSESCSSESLTPLSSYVLPCDSDSSTFKFFSFWQNGLDSSPSCKSVASWY